MIIIKRIIKRIVRLSYNLICFLRFPNLFLRNVHIHPLSIVTGNIYFGSGTRINGPARIKTFSGSSITFGKNCGIGSNLTVISRNHKTNYINLQDRFANEHSLPSLSEEKDVVIGNGCWIGHNVVILPGVTIGEGVVIGAGSIVTKDLPDYCIAAGNPAHLIRYRFSKENRKFIKDLNFHDMSNDQIQNMRDVFRKTYD